MIILYYSSKYLSLIAEISLIQSLRILNLESLHRINPTTRWLEKIRQKSNLHHEI